MVRRSMARLAAMVVRFRVSSLAPAARAGVRIVSASLGPEATHDACKWCTIHLSRRFLLPSGERQR